MVLYISQIEQRSLCDRAERSGSGDYARSICEMIRPWLHGGVLDEEHAFWADFRENVVVFAYNVAQQNFAVNLQLGASVASSTGASFRDDGGIWQDSKQ